jgi:hypothetical protein
MTLTDGALAALAQQAADAVGSDAGIRVRPQPNDDPYRWGGHGWLVHIDPDIEVWISAESSSDEALERLVAALRSGGGPDHRS